MLKVDSQRVLVVLAAIMFVGLVYMKVPGTYFCAYDDFIEVHRAAFVDATDPSKIITTPHFTPLMYRPINRAVNFLTYRLGDFNPELYRTRNVAFHLINVVLVYLLAWKLFRSLGISAVGALLFGLHPVANQTIIGAVDTNSISHAAFITALLMLMRSLETNRNWGFWLGLSMFTASLGVMTYDSAVVVFGLMLFWLGLNRSCFRDRFNSFRYMAAFFLLSGSVLTLYFFLRNLYASSGFTKAASVIPPGVTVLKNAVMYIASLLLPLDVVLANGWLGTPLPSEIQFNPSWAFIVFFSVISVAVGYYCVKRVKNKLCVNDRIGVAFICVGITMPLLPVVFLRSHPSETYLYLPVAFYSILLSYGLSTIIANSEGLKRRSFYFGTVIILVGLFASATWLRNDRVFKCGQTARQVLYSLPKLLSAGRWTVFFANTPGEDTTRRYGFYGFRGVDTIGHGPNANRAITAALQLVYRNKLLAAQVVTAQELVAFCREPRSEKLGVLVHSDGRPEIYCL